MPWKEPGKGDQDPWKSGDQPPDLDEVFRNMRSKMRGVFGGGSGAGNNASSSGGGGLIPLLLIGALLWVAWDSVHIIDETERGVVLRFGEYTRDLPPGINLTFPRPIESLQVVSFTVRSIEDRGYMLTEDENLVEFDYKVQYRVSNAQEFLFKVRNPELTVQQAAESALRESVGTNQLDNILEGTSRDAVRLETQRVLQETLDRYQIGIAISEFNLTDVNVPSQVREAYSDVIRAREDQQRFIEEARVHANSVIPEARGAAARIVQEAQGYRDATIALADGEADRFSALLTEYQLAPEITRKRLYLETMQSVMAGSNKVLLDVEASGNVLYLPLDSMGAGASNGGAPTRMPPLVAPDNSGPAADRGARSGRNPNREGR